jgi:hypothetical protein
MTKPYVAQGAKLLEPMLEDFVSKVAPEVEERAEALQPGAGDQIRNLQENPEALEQLQQVDSDDFQRLLEQLQQQQQGQ